MNIEIITEAVKRAKDGVINLGTANGWGQSNRDQCNELRKFMVQGSQESRNLGRCYNEYSFNSIIEGQTYKVVYTVDSGD